MSYRSDLLAALLLLASTGIASAADLAPTPVKATPIVDVPFFIVNDNRVTYAFQPTATDPGVPGTTAKQVYAFTHFDAWAYGTNFINLNMNKSDHADPAAPCGNFHSPVFGCSGATEFFGTLRSTFGWNQIFGTQVFRQGPMHDVSFEVGADGEVENNFVAPNKKAVVAGLQFAIDLPYKGFFDVAPLYYQEWNHNAFVMPSYSLPSYPGVTDGDTRFKATWAIEVNYYMDLGFLPEYLRYFAVSGRAGFYGPKGTGAPDGVLSPPHDTAIEINSEPIRLTFDASKAIWGQKYSHFTEVWVAYRYWQNKYGLDDSNPANTACFTAGVNNRSCTEKTIYSGVTVKF